MNMGSLSNKAMLAKVASAPILDDLAHLGIVVDWVSDLYIKKLNYKEAIPVLLDWLPRIDNPDVKEAVIRALSIPSARPVAARPLIEEFKKTSPESLGLKWSIANALSVVADDDVFEEVTELVQDRKNGKAREMLVLALGNMENSRAPEILIDLLKDDVVCGHAIMSLGKLGSGKAYPEIDIFLNHPKSWIRREAKKALQRIEKKNI